MLWISPNGYRCLAVADTAKDTQYFVFKALTHAQVRSAPVAWKCLTENMPDTDLRDRVCERQSLSGGWKMLFDWFLPRSIAAQVKLSNDIDADTMEYGEERMELICRVGKIVSNLSSLGVPK